MFQLQGIIKYYHSWVIAWVAEDLDKYYRSLLPKAWNVQVPMNSAHLSIVRKFECPTRAQWGRHEGETIIIDVIPGIQTDGMYFWLDCFSDEVGYLRRMLGLKTFRENQWSDYNCYHITVGNLKNVSKSDSGKAVGNQG
jgi:hypothetical protein